MFDESEVKVVVGLSLLVLLAAAVLALVTVAGVPGVRCGTCVSQQSGSGAGPITLHCTGGTSHYYQCLLPGVTQFLV